MKFYQYFLLLVLVALLPDGASAQQRFKIRNPLRESDSRGIPGEIRVKISRDAFARRPSIAMFGEAAERYGIYAMDPWIDPKLLTLPMPKTAAGGRHPEPPTASLARIMTLRYSALDAPEEVAMALSRIPGVEYAEAAPRRELLYSPNDPFINQQFHLDMIRAREAWDQVRGDATMLMAITDTGIERLHSDLKDAIWYNPGESGKDGQGRDKATNGVDDDNNQFIDDWWGWDFAGSSGITPDNDPSPGAEEHGTHVTGIAAATGDNATGVVGVAFGVKVLAVKVTDDRPFPSTKLYHEMDGVLYAARMGAKVINCSWGGTTSSRAEQETFHMITHDLGVVVVAAAGNNGLDQRYYPASYDGVISVGAINASSGKWGLSNYNYRLDIAAPGDAIYSTVLGNGYGTIGGTSMASPMVSAAAALVRKRYPGLNAEQVGELLRFTADDITGSIDPTYAGKLGKGRLNVRRAVETDPMSVSSARMVNYTVVESTVDGALDAGETVRLRLDVRNILGNASHVVARIAVVSGGSIAIPSPAMDFGPMAGGQTLTSADSAFSFVVPAAIPPNTQLHLLVTVETPDGANAEHLFLQVAPTYLTTDLNDIITTFNSVGNIAFNGNDHDQGDGLDYKSNENVLFHGGLMIGTGPDHLADVVRTGGLYSDPADGFRPTQLYRLRTLPDSSKQVGTAAFNDAHLGAAGVGVDVSMETYEYREAGSSNIVLVVYHIRNTNATALEGLRCGLFLDWDVSKTGFNDQVGFDPAYKLAYARDASGTTSLHMGTALLTPQQAGFYGMHNGADALIPATAPQQKWTMMSSGVHENSSIDDMSMVVSAGPISLPPGATTDVAFALFGAESFAALRESATRAGALLALNSAPPVTPAAGLAVQVSPNPFAGSVSLGFTMPAPGAAALAVYNLRGEKVETLFDGRLDAGRHSFPFTAEGLPDGVYLYELRVGGVTERGTMVRMRR